MVMNSNVTVFSHHGVNGYALVYLDTDTTAGFTINTAGGISNLSDFTLKTSLEIRKKYGDKVIFAPTIFQMYPGSDTYNNPEKFGISI